MKKIIIFKEKAWSVLDGYVEREPHDRRTENLKIIIFLLLSAHCSWIAFVLSFTGACLKNLNSTVSTIRV